MTEVSLATLIDEIDRMKSLINKLKTYDRDEGIFVETVKMSREDARLVQRCIQSYMDILLEQKVRAGDY
jgi:hypothetical protein